MTSFAANNTTDRLVGVPNTTIGTLRSTTATSTKPSPQNVTLHCRELLAVRPSPSRRTLWAKYPKKKLVRAVSE